MTERRIPYSLPMARARRAGLKTMTRRVVRKQWGPDAVVAEVAATTPEGWQVSGHSGLWWDDAGACLDDAVRCPYGAPGDILLPVEPWRAPVEWDNTKPADIPAGTPIWLDATGPAPEGFGRYRHARFMPAHLIAARDEVVSVRVERLQDISEADALAEGIRQQTTTGWFSVAGMNGAGTTARAAYALLWNTINGPNSWAANPWVWAIEFRVVVPC